MGTVIGTGERKPQNPSLRTFLLVGSLETPQSLGTILTLSGDKEVLEDPSYLESTHGIVTVRLAAGQAGVLLFNRQEDEYGRLEMLKRLFVVLCPMIKANGKAWPQASRTLRAQSLQGSRFGSPIKLAAMTRGRHHGVVG